MRIFCGNIQYKTNAIIRFVALGILIFNLLSCKSQLVKINEETQFDAKSTEWKKIHEAFSAVSKEIDEVYSKDTTRIELYLQIDETGIIEKVANYDDVPESTFASYNLVRNKSGEIIYIAEYPTNMSGDWSMIYESYFDKAGNLIAFIRKCSFFNGECAEVVHEKSEYYYGIHHNLIKKNYEIVDGDGKPLDYKKCTLFYRYDYKIYTTLEKYLEVHKFKG